MATCAMDLNVYYIQQLYSLTSPRLDGCFAAALEEQHEIQPSKSNIAGPGLSAHDSNTASRWMLITGIICVAAALRAPFTSVGPLLEMIRDDLGLSNTLAGAITTLPLLAFALLSPFAPQLARKVGLANILMLAMLTLSMGILVRSASGTVTLFAGTTMIGLSIAVCNVLLPGLIKGNSRTVSA